MRKRKKIKHRGKKKKKIKTTDDVSTNGKDNGAKVTSQKRFIRLMLISVKRSIIMDKV